MRKTACLITAIACMIAPSSALAGKLPAKIATDSYGTHWHRIGEDNFTKDAPMGSFATNDPNKVVYVGDHGLKYYEAPDNAPCNFDMYAHCYMPSKVLSVHDGVLDFYLHNCTYADGYLGPCGANPGVISPLTNTPYQRYGRYMIRLRFIQLDKYHLDNYHMAFLLWPQVASESSRCGESDFPEEFLETLSPRNISVNVFWHECPGPQQHFYKTLDMTKWHTYTQEWGPGFRRYYIGKRLVGQSTLGATTMPERWTWHMTVRNTDPHNTRGHVLIDWIWMGH